MDDDNASPVLIHTATDATPVVVVNLYRVDGGRRVRSHGRDRHYGHGAGLIAAGGATTLYHDALASVADAL